MFINIQYTYIYIYFVERALALSAKYVYVIRGLETNYPMGVLCSDPKHAIFLKCELPRNVF